MKHLESPLAVEQRNLIVLTAGGGFSLMHSLRRKNSLMTIFPPAWHKYRQEVLLSEERKFALSEISVANFFLPPHLADIIFDFGSWDDQPAWGWAYAEFERHYPDAEFLRWDLEFTKVNSEVAVVICIMYRTPPYAERQVRMHMPEETIEGEVPRSHSGEVLLM